MVYIIDTHGTTQAVITEPVYQGSTGVNDILLLAPFPANYQITVSCILPNGIPLRNVYPMQAVVLPVELQDINKNNYTCFKTTIYEMLTTVAGSVQVQFKVVGGLSIVNGTPVPRVLATYTTAFNVGVGIPTEPLQIPSGSDDINIILGYLASLDYDPITSVVYETNSEYLIATNTVDGETTGIETAFDTPKMVSIIQIFMQAPTENVRLNLAGKATANGMYEPITSVDINATSSRTPIVERIYIDGTYSSISIDPTVPIIVEKVEYFEPNDSGKYVLKFRSGAETDIDIGATVEMLRRQIETALENAANASTNAQTALENANTALSVANQASSNIDEALQNSQTALAEIPKTYFESTFRALVSAALGTPIKNGDVFIDLEEQAPDFIVFSVGQFDTSGLTALTRAMVEDNTLPTPSVGDKYLLENTSGGAPQFGIVALEGGLNAPVLNSTPLTLFGFDAMGGATNFKIAQNVPGIETDSSAIVDIAILANTVGSIETALDNIITLQNQYINGGTT